MSTVVKCLAIAAGVIGGFYACVAALVAAAMITGRYSP